MSEMAAPMLLAVPDGLRGRLGGAPLRSRLLAASAGAHAAGLAVLLLPWNNPAPASGPQPVEIVLEAPMPSEPAARAAPVPSTDDATEPAAVEPPAPASPSVEAVALPADHAPSPERVASPSLQPAIQPVVRRESKAVRPAPPARPAPKPPDRQDAATTGTLPAAQAHATSSSLPPPPPDTGPISISNPRFRAPPTPPAYPPLAREQGQEGEAVIRARLDREGNPEEVLLASSSGSAMLDRAALAAVRRWAFEPGYHGGQPVSAWVQIPVRFALR